MNQNSSIRDSNIEMLRIISMVMIIASHFAVHGKYQWCLGDTSVSHIWIALTGLLGKIGVDIFILISGYYLIDSKNFFVKPQKIIKYLGQLYFYSIGIFLVFALVSYLVHIPLEWHDSIIFPVLSNLWWFASIYFWMFLLHGFLNRLFHNLTQTEYQKLVMLLLFCFCLIPSVLRKSYHSELLWFMILYAFAGYIRKYDTLLPFCKRLNGFCYVLIGVIIFSFSACLRIAGIAAEKSMPLLASHSISLGDMHSVFTFLIAVFLFSAFSKFKIRNNRWINIIASATFGVYLIHDHPAVRTFLWHTLFENHLFQNSVMIIPYSVMVIVWVYLICTGIDLLRTFLFERPFMKLVEQTEIYWMMPIDKIAKSLKKCLNKD